MSSCSTRTRGCSRTRGEIRGHAPSGKPRPPKKCHSVRDPMNEYEALLLKHGQPLLGPGEKFEGMARVGSPANLLRMRHFVAGASAKRLVLVELPSGVLGSRPEFVGVRSIPYRDIESFVATGLLNTQAIHIDLRSGESLRMDLNTLRRYVPGQSG